MADFIGEDLSGSRFERVNLAGSQFERINLSGAEFRASDVVLTRFRGVEMSGVMMRGVALFDVDIYGEIGNLTINGVDVGPLVNTELDRRYPERAKMRPTTPPASARRGMSSSGSGAAPSNGPAGWTPSFCTSPSMASGHS